MLTADADTFVTELLSNLLLMSDEAKTAWLTKPRLIGQVLNDAFMPTLTQNLPEVPSELQAMWKKYPWLLTKTLQDALCQIYHFPVWLSLKPTSHRNAGEIIRQLRMKTNVSIAIDAQTTIKKADITPATATRHLVKISGHEIGAMERKDHNTTLSELCENAAQFHLHPCSHNTPLDLCLEKPEILSNRRLFVAMNPIKIDGVQKIFVLRERSRQIELATAIDHNSGPDTQWLFEYRPPTST